MVKRFIKVLLSISTSAATPRCRTPDSPPTLHPMFIIPVATGLNSLLMNLNDPGAHFKAQLCGSYQNGGLCRKAGM